MAGGGIRSFFADTLALVVFFTIAGALNERFIAGMSWSEVAVSRSIGAPLMVLTARPYGLWRDWVMHRFATRWPVLADGQRCSRSRCRFMPAFSGPAGQVARA